MRTSPAIILLNVEQDNDGGLVTYHFPHEAELQKGGPEEGENEIQSLLTRFTRARPASCGLGPRKMRDCAGLWRFSRDYQAVSETTTRGRACATQSDSWSSSEETGTGGGWRNAPITSA